MSFEETVNVVMKDVFETHNTLRERMCSINAELTVYKYCYENPEETKGLDVAQAIEYLKESEKEEINRSNKKK